MRKSPPRSARLGPLAAVAALVALVAGYVNDCFSGLGFAPAPGGRVDEAREVVGEKVQRTAEAIARPRVVVKGEQCRVGDVGLRPCATVCDELAAGVDVEVEATAGTQQTVEALRACLKRRGVKVHLVAE
jgi:hypothetical protein